ncbi:DUF1385 domain-containing protein [Alkalicoccus daliensis]|uniref:DUF1385 domain-containing protein n=1 Tax=Alkalicoccus daliensis TaxID=745820 RepID=A0A1H0B8C8_9BACI|nr:DUF1385 domain-containing protein [Alkalicoccus daliensis]SDN41613.1 Protein of unknown function [Alkalicoccus daliensis]
MIRGISHAKGIMFFSPACISHAWNVHGQIHHQVNAYSKKGVLFECIRAFFMLPARFIIIILGSAAILISTYFFDAVPPISFHYYLIFLFSFHFWFPKEMKKFHAAEHQVFSCRGEIRGDNLSLISKSSVINRNCSTNVIVLFFISLFLLFLLGNVFLPAGEALAASTYIAAVLSFAALGKWFKSDKYLIKKARKISYWLQRKVTTSIPQRIHVQTAITAYENLKRFENEKKSGE